MASNTVLSLIIRARDQASGILGRINDGITGLGSSAKKSQFEVGSLTNAITGGVIQANLLGAAFGKIQQGIGAVQGKFMEAARLQTENIQNIGTLSAITGISYEQSTEFVDELNIKIAEMGKSLPVAAQDIKSVAGAIQDDLVEAFKTANGVDFKGLEGALVGISSDFAVLGKSANVAAGDVQQGLARFLGGASEGDYLQLNLFQRNNALKNELKRQLGGRKSEALSVKERVQILQNVGGKLNSAETKKRLAESVEGLISNFNDSLFDPDTGLFGFMKDLDPTTKKKESVFTSFNTALNELIGSNGVFTNLSLLLKSMGIKLADPMVVLKGGIDFAISALTKINEALGAAREFFNMGSTLPEVISSLASYFGVTNTTFENIGKSIKQFFDKVVINLQGFFTNLSTTLLPQILTIAQNIDPGAISGAVWYSVNQLLNGIYKVLQSIDWELVLKIGATVLDKVMKTNLPLIISGLIIVGTGLIAGIGAILAAIAATKITAVLAVAAFSIGYFLGTTLLEWWTETAWPAVTQWWASASTLAVGLWNNTWNTVGNFFNNIFTGINDWWAGLIAGINNWWKDLSTNLRKTWDQAWLGVANKFTEIINTITGWWGTVMETAKNKISETIKDPMSLFRQPATPTAASGNAVTGLTSLTGARTTTVTSGGQMLAMAGSSATARRSTSLNFAPTFNLQGVSDPEAIAQLALEKLDFMVQDYVAGSLA